MATGQRFPATLPGIRTHRRPTGWWRLIPIFHMPARGHLEDDVFTTEVSFALNPGWVGGQQVRGVEITADDYLILSLSRAWPDGRVVSGWVKWKRADRRG